MKNAALITTALSIMLAMQAQAAVVTYDFEGASIGAISTLDFAGALGSLGVTSSTVTGATGGITGVQLNNLNNNGITGANTTVNFGRRSFAAGNLGTWTLVFGPTASTSGITRFDFAYNETESSGFDVVYYSLTGAVLQTVNIRPSGDASQQCQFANTCALVQYTNNAGIGRVTLTDLGSVSRPLGDNFFIDNITVDTIVVKTDIDLGDVPEPSTYLLISSALAVLAWRRRR
jgi:hypothetical protein